MKKLILGTVQLGLRYGINNQDGKPKKEESNRILEYAFDHGITCLDTAENYGDSEQIIGEFIKETKKTFDICTKLSAAFDCSGDFVYERLKEKLNLVKDRLGIQNIYIYYLHSFGHCKNADLLLALIKLKEEKLLKQIGVSIYEPSELEYILENCSDIIDVVQLPFNILDNSRWLKDDLLLRAKNKNIKIFVRSVLLQGLLFKNENDEFIKKIDAGRYIRFLNNLAAEKNTGILNVAYSFVDHIDQIDSILIGCESIEQLQQNVALMNAPPVINKIDSENTIDYCTSINPNIIDPRKW